MIASKPLNRQGLRWWPREYFARLSSGGQQCQKGDHPRNATGRVTIFRTLTRLQGNCAETLIRRPAEGGYIERNEPAKLNNQVRRAMAKWQKYELIALDEVSFCLSG